MLTVYRPAMLTTRKNAKLARSNLDCSPDSQTLTSTPAVPGDTNGRAGRDVAELGGDVDVLADAELIVDLDRQLVGVDAAGRDGGGDTAMAAGRPGPLTHGTIFALKD